MRNRAFFLQIVQTWESKKEIQLCGFVTGLDLDIPGENYPFLGIKHSLNLSLSISPLPPPPARVPGSQAQPLTVGALDTKTRG